MATPYSQDLRQRVLRAYARGMPTKQVAETFGVSRSWARRVKQRYRDHGETAARRMGSPGVTIVDRGQLAALVEQHPDATLAELRELLGVQCALSTLCEALKQLGLTFKKRRFTPPSRSARTWPHNGCNGVTGLRRSTPAA